MNGMRSRRLGVVLIALSLAAVGCSATTDSPSAGAGGEATSVAVPSAGAGGGATSVAVTLQEWAVLPESDSAPAGDVTFTVTNEGPEDIHEFVVLKTDLDPAELPVDADGVVSEAGEGIEVIDEVEDLPVGESQDLTVTLEAGSYVLLCNIWSEDESEAHYTMGMRVAFTATD